MEKQGKETGEKRPMAATILYGMVIILVAAGAVVLIARYAFNVDLVNFDEIAGTIFVKRR